MHQGCIDLQAVATAHEARVYREQEERAALHHVATFAHRGARVGPAPAHRQSLGDGAQRLAVVSELRGGGVSGGGGGPIDIAVVLVAGAS